MTRRMARQSRLTLVLVVLLALAPGGAGAGLPRPRVYVVLVDGLGADALAATAPPVLRAMIHGATRGRFYTRAQAVMPTVTITNHVSVATGVYPAAHGMTGNTDWERGSAQQLPLTRPDQIEVDTVFTAIRRRRQRSAGIFGKLKLAEVFGDGGGNRAPERVWGDAASEPPASTPGSDVRTMDEVLATIGRDDPSFVLVNLGDVDRLSHVFGPDSPEARRAILTADRQIGRLVRLVKARGLWRRAVLIVSADHGFSVDPDAPGPPRAVMFGVELARAHLAGLATAANGGAQSIYLRGLDSGATELTPTDATDLKSARALALAQAGVAEALYRMPNPADGGARFTIDRVHPDWRLSHPRVGELLLVARPGFFFSDALQGRPSGARGTHGDPAAAHVPLIVVGGYARLRPGMAAEERPVAAPDVGMTARWLLGLDPPRYGNGTAVPTTLAGRILAEAFLP